MPFRPLRNRVLIRRVAAETKSAGGILIPETAAEKPVEGDVVAIGPGMRDTAGVLHALDVTPGDRVLFGKWSGTELKLDGEELLVMPETDILGIVRAETAKKNAA